jgi:aromatic-L-amino-acid/L-tryptophan decarboxylase
MNIVCFRYNPGKLSTDALNALNKEILIRLQKTGIAALSNAFLNGQ